MPAKPADAAINSDVVSELAPQFKLTGVVERWREGRLEEQKDS